jgi:hypothetical protein
MVDHGRSCAYYGHADFAMPTMKSYRLAPASEAAARGAVAKNAMIAAA